MLHCVCRLPQRELEVHLICVHLGLQDAHRQQQIELLCDMITRELPPEAPLVVAGDFNDWRLRGHRQLERCTGVREVFVHAHGRAARTFPARMPLLQLDRIYVRNASVHRPIVLPNRPWSHLSDHAPLAAEIVL
jgi:endonuclease/exonuclease/phosphatase family metal-dependent hydrolase